MVKADKPTRSFELDSLRGLAAFYVMLFHYVGVSKEYNLLTAGITGVDLFFIISGYVIFMTLQKSKRPLDFVISRCSRLWPTYITCMALTLLCIAIFDSEQFPTAITILLNLTMQQTLFFVDYIDESYWTLTVELLFYGLMLVLLIKNKLPQIIIIGSAILIFLACFYYFLSPYSKDKIYIVPTSFLPLMGHFQLFFAGILFYKMKFARNKWYSHLLILGCYIFSLYLFGKSGRAHFAIDFWIYSFMIFIYFLLFYLFVNNKLKFLNISILIFLGDISYALYLIHNKAGTLLLDYFSQNFSMHRLVIISFVIIIIICLAALITYKIERPVIKFIRAKYTSRQSLLIQ